MSYTFKVGDKGKTRGGEDYEVICVEPRASSMHQVIALLNSDVTDAYNIHGKMYDSEVSERDLLPPSRKVRVRFVKFEGGKLIALSEEEPAFGCNFGTTIYDHTIEVELPE